MFYLSLLSIEFLLTVYCNVTNSNCYENYSSTWWIERLINDNALVLCICTFCMASVVYLPVHWPHTNEIEEFHHIFVVVARISQAKKVRANARNKRLIQSLTQMEFYFRIIQFVDFFIEVDLNSTRAAANIKEVEIGRNAFRLLPTSYSVSGHKTDTQQ